MAYVDVSPMMVAFRTSPEDFEMRGGWLHHIPSRHQFLFGPDDKVQLVAECNCASLSIKSGSEPSVDWLLPPMAGHLLAAP